jgi:hypothetical protein
MKFLLQVMHNICGNHHKHPYMGFFLSTITCQKKDKKFTSLGAQWQLFPHKVLLKAIECGKNLANAKKLMKGKERKCCKKNGTCNIQCINE